MYLATAAVDSAVSPNGSISDFRTKFEEATSRAQAGGVVADAIVAKPAKSMTGLQDGVDLLKPMHAYGVDKLLAVELRSWISKDFRADVAVFEILGGASFATVGVVVAGKSALRKAEWTAQSCIALMR